MVRPMSIDMLVRVLYQIAEHPRCPLARMYVAIAKRHPKRLIHGWQGGFCGSLLRRRVFAPRPTRRFHQWITVRAWFRWFPLLTPNIRSSIMPIDSSGWRQLHPSKMHASVGASEFACLTRQMVPCIFHGVPNIVVLSARRVFLLRL